MRRSIARLDITTSASNRSSRGREPSIESASTLSMLGFGHFGQMYGSLGMHVANGILTAAAQNDSRRQVSTRHW